MTRYTARLTLRRRDGRPDTIPVPGAVELFDRETAAAALETACRQGIWDQGAFYAPASLLGGEVERVELVDPEDIVE